MPMGPREEGLLDVQGKAPPEELQVDAFCIGAPKCGSTWLAQVMDEHPEIQVSRPKEPNFFTTKTSPYLDHPPPAFLSSWEWYAQCFPKKAPVSIDFSIHNLRDPEAPKRIHSVFPDARFLLILRDPVKRLYSAYRHAERGKLNGHLHHQTVEPTFEQALQNEELVRRSRYAQLLEPWLQVFPRERFHVIINETARNEPLEILSESFRFLDVDDNFRPPRVDRKVHPTPARRGLQRTLEKRAQWARAKGLGWIVDPISQRFPYRHLKRIDAKKVQYAPMDPRLEAELRRHFLPEIERLEDMMDLDLRVWKPRENGNP